jgi:hypothetical protein
MPPKAGHVVAKALGIKLQEHDPFKELDRPGASMMSDRTDHTFVEEPPLVLDYLNNLIPSGKELYEYLLSLFPFLSWIGHYNLQWLIGDLVAGKVTFLWSQKQVAHSSQASPSAPLSSLRAWPTPSWLTWMSNSVCTRPSWVSSSIGSLRPPRISPLV